MVEDQMSRMLAEVVQARHRIDLAAFESITADVVRSALYLRSFYDLLHGSNQDALSSDNDSNVPRLVEYEVATKLAAENLDRLCNQLDTIVEVHLVPSGFTEILDRWAENLSAELRPADLKVPKGQRMRRWCEHTVERMQLPPRILAEFRTAAFRRHYREAAALGGTRLALLASAELMRRVRSKLDNPSPEMHRRLSRWGKISAGVLIFAIGVAEIGLDVVTFEPLHSGISLGGGVCSVVHGSHVAWHAVKSGRPAKEASPQSLKPRADWKL